MSQHHQGRYFYRSFSTNSAGQLKCGKDQVGPRLSRAELLDEFGRHKIKENRTPTALISASVRPIEALHRVLQKYYNSHEDPNDI